MQDTIITDDHIDFIERKLFPKFDFSNNAKVFDVQRRNVIKCMETKDIVACAGSGKTTTLIAKLMILDRFHMEFPQNQGICVLTHTNVAIDEIKEKLGATSRLLTYPNFFGTIQSFVNKFLTIPMYLDLYNEKPTAIDKDLYDNKIIDFFFKKCNTKTKNTLIHKFPNDSTDYYDRYIYLIKNMSFNNSSVKTIREVEETDKDNLRVLKDAFLKQQKILNFEDAYFLAKQRITEKKYSEKLIKLFQARFKFVFIDEMQDTETHQKEIVDIIFNDKVILQSIGDNNQAIYTRAQDICWQPKPDTTIEITGSKRFHNEIASISSKICENGKVLEGNEGTEYSPVIILFEDINFNKVLEKFGQVIYDKGIYTESDFSEKKTKAIGGITIWKDTDKHTIKSYMPSFEKNKISNFEFSKLKKILTVEHNSNNCDTQYYSKKIMGAVIKMLVLIDYPITREQLFIKEFSTKFPAEYEDFLFKLTKWCRNMYLRQDIYDEVKNYFEINFKNIFPYKLDNRNVRYFLDDLEKSQTDVSLHTFNNKYEYINEEIKFDIEIGTVHSVKGETHAATLYLETVAYDERPNPVDYDIKQILGYFKGNHTTPSSDLQKRILRIAHVAITRPKYLLCVAIHKSSLTNFDDDKQDLIDAGWQIEEI